MPVRIDLLGAPAVILDERVEPLAANRMSALLIYLAHASEWVRRAEVIDLMWPAASESRGRNRLRQLLLATRRKHAFANLEADGDSLRWVVASDVQHVREARDDAHVVELVSGWFLDGFHVDDAHAFGAWVEGERTRLHDRWRRAALRLSAHLEGEGRDRDAQRILERVTTRDPLDEEAVRRHLALLRNQSPDLARDRYRQFAETLAEELGTEPDASTRALLERPPETATGPDAQDAKRRAPKLPVDATSFVGRARELAEAQDLVARADCRLLTVYAPGGMGKTRFALELGRRAASDGDEVRFASLVHARDGSAALALVASALGVTLYGARPVTEQIAASLGERRQLLILDNVEHLDLEPAIAELLELAPNLTILATSRRRLGIPAEWSFDLGGLEVPPDALEPGATPPDPLAWDATRLFVQRARQRRRSSTLTDEERRAIARIAARVGGMPLAIELAARWSELLAASEIDAELAQRIGGLAAEHKIEPGEPEASSPRHRSVALVLDQSWAHLGDAERTAMRRLSVMHGFTANDARAVAAVEPGTLRTLIDHAFVAPTDGTRVPRFDMHPLVRAFCAARTAEDPEELEVTRDAHARHYLGWAAASNDQILSEDVAMLLARFSEELDNLRAGWRHAAMRGFDALLGAALKPMEWTFRSRTWFRAWRELLEFAYERTDPEGLTHARLEMVRAANALDLGDFSAARDMGMRARDRIDALASDRFARINPHPAAEVRRILGHIALAQGRPRDAGEMFTEALDLLDDGAVDPFFAARLADYLGSARAVAGDLDDGIRWTRRSVRELRTLRDPGCLAVALSNLARLELHRGDVDAAVDLSQEALELERKVGGRPRFFAEQLRSASDALRMSGRHDESARLLQEELDVIEQVPAPVRVRRAAEVHDRLGQMAFLSGDAETAARHLDGATTPHACRFALLQGDPERSQALCARWLETPSRPGRLMLDLDPFVDRAYVLACSAEAAIERGATDDGVRDPLVRSLRLALVWGFPREILRGAAVLAKFHAERGDRNTATRLAAYVAHHPVCDAETKGLARRLGRPSDRVVGWAHPGGRPRDELAKIVAEAIPGGWRDGQSPALA